MQREPSSSLAQHAKLDPTGSSKSKHGPSQWVPLTAVQLPRALHTHVGASANCQHLPWLGQAAAVPLRKLQRGIGIPGLPGALLPIPKDTVLLCKGDGKAMETPREPILPEPRTPPHTERAVCFPEMCSSQNNDIKIVRTRADKN